MDFTGQKGPDRQHHGTSCKMNTQLSDDAGNPGLLRATDRDRTKNQIIHGLLEGRQVWLVFENVANSDAIQLPVCLCPRGPHRWPFA